MFKYCAYGLLLLFLYILQTTPGLLEVLGIKPFFIVPAVICIAMYEGEFVGGLFGAYGGLLCDLGSYTIFGFYSILLLIICTATGLAIIYLMKQNRLNAIIIGGGAMLALGILEHFFYYTMWGYEGVWLLLLTKMIPRVIYSLLFVPFYYWLFGRLREYFASKFSA